MKKKNVAAVFMIIFLTLMALKAQANCSCSHDPYKGDAKKYSVVSKTWWGAFHREWTCKYTCVGDDGFTEVVYGSYKRTSSTDDGRLGICQGTIYKEQYNSMSNWFVFMLEGTESFSPHDSSAPELKTWAHNHCR